jgi:hypothetical protein
MCISTLAAIIIPVVVVLVMVARGGNPTGRGGGQLLCDKFFFSFFLFSGVYVEQVFFFSSICTFNTFLPNNYNANTGFTLDLYKFITSNGVFSGFVSTVSSLLTPGNGSAAAFCSDLFNIGGIGVSRYGWCNSGVSTFQFLRGYGDGGGGVGILGFAALALDTLLGQGAGGGMAFIDAISHFRVSGGSYFLSASGMQDLCYAGLRWYEVEFCICLYWVLF